MTIIDFTGSVPGAKSLAKFGDEVMQVIRSKDKLRAVAVIDRAVGELDSPVIVRDHLNLTGWSPLCGPNDPCGERFPVVQGIYIEDAMPKVRKVIAAGLKQGAVPNHDESVLLKSLGAEASCYNLVPTMLVAAHSCCKVLGVLVPAGGSLTPELIEEIKKLIGDAA